MKNPLSSIRKRWFGLSNKPQLAQRRDANWLLVGTNWIDRRILAGATFENNLVAFATQKIATTGIDLFIDIGANIGFYTVLLGKMNQIKSVVAFEPVAANYNQLCANVFLNHLDSKVTTHRIGLGDKPNEATIHIDPASTGISRLDVASSGRPAATFQKQERIVIQRFDDVITVDPGRKTYVKIDVEGFAPQCLAGMTVFLKQARATLQIELSEHEHEPANKLLSELGFKNVLTLDGDYIFERAE